MRQLDVIQIVVLLLLLVRQVKIKVDRPQLVVDEVKGEEEY